MMILMNGGKRINLLNSLATEAELNDIIQIEMNLTMLLMLWYGLADKNDRKRHNIH